jgi:hypothetical protein
MAVVKLGFILFVEVTEKLLPLCYFLFNVEGLDGVGIGGNTFNGCYDGTATGAAAKATIAAVGICVGIAIVKHAIRCV